MGNFDRFSEASEGKVKAVSVNLHRRISVYLKAITPEVKLVKLFFAFRVNIKIKINKLNIGMKDSNHEISLFPSPEAL